MNTFLVLTLALLADFTMGDVQMCFMMETQNNAEDGVEIVNHYPNADQLYIGVKACSAIEIKLFFGLECEFHIRLGLGDTTSITGGKLSKKCISPDQEYYGIGPDYEDIWVDDELRLLDCNAMRYFWVEWSSESLSFGQGLQVGSETLATYNGAEAQIYLNAKLISYGPAEIENQCVHDVYTHYTIWYLEIPTIWVGFITYSQQPLATGIVPYSNVNCLEPQHFNSIEVHASVDIS
ncbi:hypothetical protein CAPTEDRAFT_191326 [Capitella teleta]|uniref:Farnesoic acid O-methyl transferase domain-containing protein n=1 Tax=Capitella teleta TaxID=283909 RepID=R7UDN6_CAPTE|nr:hypothetical protein CAPTEDRAFT_191326 [Capitella teleta]|eukprot:ELU01898.1 hypothetical protein CAPTEDRAFT_191326 [Capitella teleta]